jgi:hypothetical protein
MLFVRELESLSIIPEIIILTEVWIYEEELFEFEIDNYNIYANCNTNYRAGGVIIYVKKCIECLSFSNINFESADGLKIVINVNSSKLNILGFYRFNFVDKEKFIHELDDYLQVEDVNTIYAGDINIDSTSDDTISVKYLLLLQSHGFNILTNQSTRVASGTCIDHIAIKIKNKPINREDYKLEICDIGITDHSLLNLKLIELFSYRKNKDILNTRINFKKLEADLSLIEWKNIFEMRDTNNAFNSFSERFLDCVTAAKETVTIKRKNCPSKSWMNESLVLRINKRRQLYKKTRQQPNNDKLKAYYENYKRALKNDLKYAKNNYFRVLCDECKNNKEQWLLINKLIGVKKAKNKVIESIKLDDGEIINDKYLIAENFNNYFLDIPQQIKQDIEIENEDIDSTYNEYFNNPLEYRNSFYMYPTYEEEISNVLNSMKNKRSTGIDGLGIDIIKRMRGYILKVLVHIFNLSMEDGIFPSILKKSIVIPLHKGGDLQNMGNYRPISLLSVLSKILERLVKIRLVNFLEKNGFFSRNQFGFRKGKSTQDALLKFTSELFEGKNRGNQVAGLFLDMKKAFDMVDHDILLDKMYKAGIRGVCNSWFESYLKERKQQVKLYNILSNEGQVKYGVPQGSVLGAVLFIIYINDLCEGNLNGKVTTFADDTALSYENKYVDIIKEEIEADLSRIRIWLTKNRLALNVLKTNFIIFQLKNHPNVLSSIKYHDYDCLLHVNCKCSSIPQTKSIKYLGIILDMNLSWKDHLSKLRKEIGLSIYKFYYLRDLCSSKVLKILYQSLVESRLMYGIICWGGTYFTNLKILLTAQKHIIRLITHQGKRVNSFPLFKTLGILPLRYLYVYRVSQIFYKRCNEYNKYFNVKSGREIRLLLPLPKLEAFRRFYKFIAPKFFNALPANVKESKTLYKFRKSLFDWLFEVDNLEKILFD